MNRANLILSGVVNRMIAEGQKPIEGIPAHVWWSSSSGLIELQFKATDTDLFPRPGHQDSQVKALSLQPHIRKQTDLIDADLLFKELKEYGAWDDLELRDHHQNIQRLLWVAINDMIEGNN